MIKSILIVAVGGALGSVLRFLLQRQMNTLSFPVGTLLVNTGGCFLIGLLWGLFHKSFTGEAFKLLLMTGFCGGFTTFSAFSLESLQLLEANRGWTFFIYLTGSVAGGLLATFGGYKITN